MKKHAPPPAADKAALIEDAIALDVNMLLAGTALEIRDNGRVYAIGPNGRALSKAQKAAISRHFHQVVAAIRARDAAVDAIREAMDG